MEWISVKDRLPNVLKHDEFPCLVSFRGVVCMAWYHIYGEFEFPNGMRTKEVTHWMPLPEPPKGE